MVWEDSESSILGVLEARKFVYNPNSEFLSSLLVRGAERSLGAIQHIFL